MSTLETNTIAQLIEIHDAIEDIEPLGKWKGRKDDLIKKVSAAIKASRRGRTIKDAVDELLFAADHEKDGNPIGYPYDYVLARVLEEFPEANTTIKCIRWYNARLNANPSIRMPVRPRKKAQAVEAADPLV